MGDYGPVVPSVLRAACGRCDSGGFDLSLPLSAAPPTRVLVRAAAKVNLALRVGPVRADGYHDVVTVLQSIGLQDELEVRVLDDLPERAVPGVPAVLTVSGVSGHTTVPTDGRNLVLAAAEALTVHAPGRTLRPVALHLRKRIPVAAGLAGGSADAAAALLALDAIWELHLDTAELRAIAAALGSDVPFCLSGGIQLGQGRGERLEPLPAVAPALWWVLGVDSAGLSTAAVYRRYDELGLGQPVTRTDAAPVLAACASLSPERLAAVLVNDLEAPALDLRPDLGAARAALLRAGALAARLSGSGPTVLGLCRDEPHARAVAERVTDAFDRVEVACGPVPGQDVRVIPV